MSVASPCPNGGDCGHDDTASEELEDKPRYRSANEDGPDKVRRSDYHEEKVHDKAQHGSQASDDEPTCRSLRRRCIAAATYPAYTRSQRIAAEAYREHYEGAELHPA